MKKDTKRRLPFGALPCIVALLLISGGMRIGGIGLAIASEPSAEITTEMENTAHQCEVDPDTNKLLEAITERMAFLDERELELATRSEKLTAAKILIDNNMARLIEAEEKLSNTIARVDGASEGDLDRLTSVYESMKPKVAAALFEQMDSDFAAGFLGRMNPQAAASIMSNLSTEVGYAISVVLAGRNALAPKE